MSTYAVDVAAVTAHGCAIRSAADELAAVRVGSTMAIVAQALPGGAAALDAARAGVALDAGIRAAVEVVASLADAEVTAATDYERCESVVRSSLSGDVR